MDLRPISAKMLRHTRPAADDDGSGHSELTAARLPSSARVLEPRQFVPDEAVALELALRGASSTLVRCVAGDDAAVERINRAVEAWRQFRPERKELIEEIRARAHAQRAA